MLLNGLALLGGTPSPRVVATLPKEEDLPLVDRQVGTAVSVDFYHRFLHGYPWIPMDSNGFQ